MALRFLIILLVFSSCRQNVQSEDLVNLNGYWEIKKVVFPDGASKEYNISTTIDYIEYSDRKGFRKKVQPNMDGTFTTSDDAELFQLVSKNDTFIMHYRNNLSEWEEVIKTISDDELVVVSQENLTYYYKRYRQTSH